MKPAGSAQSGGAQLAVLNLAVLNLAVLYLAPAPVPSLVEVNGIEPSTSCLQSRRSPN